MADGVATSYFLPCRRAQDRRSDNTAIATAEARPAIGFNTFAVVSSRPAGPASRLASAEEHRSTCLFCF